MGFGRLGSRFGGMGAVSPPPIITTGVAPENTVRPSFTGDAIEGEELAGNKGTWTGTATILFAYQWHYAMLDGNDDAILDGNGEPISAGEISGATSIDYTLTSDDVGERVFLEVVGTNDFGSDTAKSDASDLVEAAEAVEATDIELTSPNDWSDAAWVKSNVLVTFTDRPDPDGGNTASRIQCQTSSGEAYVRQPHGLTLGAGENFRLKGRLRSTGPPVWAFVFVDDDGSEYVGKFINTETGAAGSSDVTAGANLVSFIVTPLIDDMYEFELIGSFDAGVSAGNVLLQFADADGTLTPTTNQRFDVHAWGA